MPHLHLHDHVWCTTCEHHHIPTIPAVTYACTDCGFGAWELDVAENHATMLCDHNVLAIHHQTVPLEHQVDRPGRGWRPRDWSGSSVHAQGLS